MISGMIPGMFSGMFGGVGDANVTYIDSNSKEQQMKRINALPPDVREALLADMKRNGSPLLESGVGNQGGNQGGPASGPSTNVPPKSESNLSPELKAKKASQANLDRLSYEGKGKILGYRSGTNKGGELNKTGGKRSAVRSKGKRFDAQDAARSKSIKERGGWLGQLNRSFTGTLDKMAGGKSRYEEADKAATARVKQKGAEAIGKYYSSSDGKYYGNYQQAVDARKGRLAQLSKDQAAAKKKAPSPPSTPTQQGTGDILEKIKEVQKQESVSNPSVPSTPAIPNARGGGKVAPKPTSVLGF
jgi:hypothetical protein